MTKSEKFMHKGREFEIRAAAFDHGWTVRVFHNGKCVSPPYTASFEVETDFASHGWGRVVDELMAVARDDIENERLPKLTEAIKAAD